MDIKVFMCPHFKESCTEEQAELLKTQFKEYKKTGVAPPSFGRDTTYDFPSSVKSADMWHVHIKDATSKNWDLRQIMFDRTSNTALIYCRGFTHQNYYLLLGFLENAHDTYKEKPQYLLKLAEIAETFREKF